MGIDPKKRQKKLERQQAKQKAKHKALARQKSRGTASLLKQAGTAPILHCAWSLAVWELGIGNVLLSRSLPGGDVAFSLFLVDRYCLGVKNVFSRVTSRPEYNQGLYADLQQKGELVEAEPACARKLVEEAVLFARNLDLLPHPDYQKGYPIFGDIDVQQCGKEFEFGKDGKPFFVAGPYDSPARCREVLNLLHNRCGPDGYHYMLPMQLE